MISVLYVDDNPYEARIVTVLCERCGGVTVQPLLSAKAALEWIASHTVDVIVSEYDMPGLNGIDFLKILIERDYRIPFIIFTRCDKPSIEAQAENAGVSGFLLKNCEIKKRIPYLVDLINHVVHKRLFPTNGPL